MGNMPLKFDPSPKLLGVTMNRTLSFQPHVDKVVAKVEKRSCLLACLSTTQWGWKKKPLRKIYLTAQRSILDYAAPAWQPWLSKTEMDRLDRAQNKALRRITGQASSTPLEALRLEAGLPSYETVSKRLVAISREKAYRCPDQSHLRAPQHTDWSEAAGVNAACNWRANSQMGCPPANLSPQSLKTHGSQFPASGQFVPN
jgi:hypothetical protein